MHVFNLYDFDESCEVTIDEMTLMLKSTMSGLAKFCGIAPPDERRLEMMSQTAFSALQKDKDNALTRDEFIDYCDRTPEVRSWLAFFDDAVDVCDAIKYQMDSDGEYMSHFLACSWMSDRIVHSPPPSRILYHSPLHDMTIVWSSYS